MRLESVSIANFRCYQQEVTVWFNDLTTFIGKNDIGKSSVLEALEIFFNNETVKIESGDANVYSGDTKVSITCEFSELPPSLTLDSGAATTLAAEYLLTAAGTLKIRKVFDCKTAKPTEEISLLAHHPTAPSVENLLDLKERELQVLVKKKGLDVPLKGNPGMRQALWLSEPDLQLAEVAVPLSKGKEDGKKIWDQLQAHLPLFALFQSDRNSKDSDGEVQAPMMAAVTQALAELQAEINAIQAKVRQKTEEIASLTHDALKTIDPNLAKELTPQFTPPTQAKWKGLFSVNMETDDGIPLNKRGSGIRRLILVSFFKAAAERRLASGDKARSIIYAIEEPETAQHPNNQKILIESFKALAGDDGCQVILTTHSPGFAAELPTESIRYVTRDLAKKPCVESGVDVFENVAAALGIVADSRVKVLICVEGPTDIDALKCLSRALHIADPKLPDLSSDRRFAFVPSGGSTLQHWVAGRYLADLGRKEMHIYDSDVPDYGAAVAAVNARQDGSWATQTLKHEIESYLHPDAIKDALGVVIDVADHLNADGHAVPKAVALGLHAANPVGAPMKDSTVKKLLASKAFPCMTADRLAERDPNGEVRDWMVRLLAML
ncbi:ATP-binding protein [Acidovorax sp. M2(2025)]|uniref:ATP-binding protein n=1 Tax=Acidovorax sp. M2(2025) TaxID=3411355 RepID=UPI003BF60CB1